jgi:hypothetical protein
MALLVEKLTESKAILDKVLKGHHPAPPKITVIKEKDTAWIDSCLAPLKVVRLPLDGQYRLTDQNNFLNIVSWDWIDSRQYVKDVFDCENYAIAFKSRIDELFSLNQVGIVIDYKSMHGYNLVIFPDTNVMLLEPQTDELFIWTDRRLIFYALTGAYVLI